jgi:hypothetical protein
MPPPLGPLPPDIIFYNNIILSVLWHIGNFIEGLPERIQALLLFGKTPPGRSNVRHWVANVHPALQTGQVMLCIVRS